MTIKIERELIRVPYGKKDTLECDREYKLEGEGPVGTLTEWKEAFSEINFIVIDNISEFVSKEKIMKFEKQFPKLRECRRKIENHLNSHTDFVNYWRLERDIQKHCLSKKKVEKAVEKCLEDTGDNLGVIIFPDKLLKELGLDK